MVCGCIGSLSKEEMRRILSQHEEDLETTLGKQTKERERQMQELRQRLAEKRRNKEAALRDKHTREVCTV